MKRKQKEIFLLLGQQVESVSPVKGQAPEPLVEGDQVKRKQQEHFGTCRLLI